MQRRFVLICSIAALVGFCLWLYFEPGFEPAIGIVVSLGGIAATYWPRLPARYARKQISGRVNFDYSNNNGRYSIGTDELLFETMWTKGSGESIHVYNDPPSIDTVAIATEATSIESIKDASKYDGSSRSRTLREGEIAVLRNKNGNYAALHVIDVKDRERADDRDEVTFRYVINGAGSSDFSSRELLPIHRVSRFIDKASLWLLAILLMLSLYVLSSGAAYISIYHFPNTAPSQFYSWFFHPLDWLARQSPSFGYAYNRYHQWCYRTFAANDS